jgi:hypothetical protein
LSIILLQTGFGLDGRGSIISRGKRFFSISKSLGPLWLPGALSPGVKLGGGLELITHLHLVSRSKMVELYLYSSTCLHGIAFN